MNWNRQTLAGVIAWCHTGAERGLRRRHKILGHLDVTERRLGTRICLHYGQKDSARALRIIPSRSTETPTRRKSFHIYTRRRMGAATAGAGPHDGKRYETTHESNPTPAASSVVAESVE